MDWAERRRASITVFGVPRKRQIAALDRAATGRGGRRARAHRKAGAGLHGVSARYHDGSWSRGPARGGQGGTPRRQENPRYVVTSLPPEQWPARQLYGGISTARAGIWKPHQGNSFTCLPAAPARRRCALINFDCTSRGWRTCWSAVLRRLGLKATELATAQAATIREKLFKNRRAGESEAYGECGCRWHRATRARVCSGRVWANLRC